MATRQREKSAVNGMKKKIKEPQAIARYVRISSQKGEGCY